MADDAPAGGPPAVPPVVPPAVPPVVPPPAGPGLIQLDPAFVNHNTGQITQGDIPGRSAVYLAAVAVAQAANRAVTLADIIPANTENYHTRHDQRQDAQDLINYLIELDATNIPDRVMDIKLLSRNFPAYQRGVQVNCATAAAHGCFFGFYIVPKEKNKSLVARLHYMVHHNDVDAIRHWNEFCAPVLDFICCNVIPDSFYITWSNLMTGNMMSLRSSYGRTTANSIWRLPVWNSRFILNQPINQLAGNSCAGHMYEYLMLIDQVIPFCSDKVPNRMRHNLRPPVDVKAALRNNQVNHLYPPGV
jgi:hypothetical protein